VPRVASFLRCSAALSVAALALAASNASAADTTGGAAATPTQVPAPVAKQPTTKQIQKALGIKADGAYGPKTVRAMKKFQRAHKLRVTGRPNSETLAALGFTTTAPTTGSFDAATVPSTAATVLAKIAQCESGGNITAVSANGRYFGKYQFSQDTWENLGGVGTPDAADEPTQDAMAFKLYSLKGTAPWPACSAQIAAEDDAAPAASAPQS